jgi:multiple sugar transport system substrate-binding protein
MLYWRTDLLDGPPRSLEELASTAAAAQARAGLPYGFVWQGARYEGLVCVFLEHLGCFGGRILDDRGRVQVDSPAALAALRFMTRSIRETRIVPEAVLTWQEEQTRFAFQNGDAVYMRNWPYAYPLMADSSESAVAGKFAIAPMPPAANGAPTAALGGSLLAINAQSKHPEAAYAVIEYLTRPEQMRERAEVAGQYPTRRELYYDGSLTDLLPIPPEQVRTVIENAVPRPSTPVYTELSSLLQIRLHRALSGQVKPAVALANAAADLRRLLHEPALGASPGGSP